MKQKKEPARAPSIAQEAQSSVQNKAWHDIIAKCIEAHHKNATWQEVSDFAASRGVTMSPAFVRQGCRILFAALDAGLTLSSADAAKTFDMGVPYDQTDPYEMTMTEDEVTQMYIVTGVRLQQFYRKKQVSYEAIREFYGISDEFEITAVKVNNWNSGREGSAQLKVSLKPKTVSTLDLHDFEKITRDVLKGHPGYIERYAAPVIDEFNQEDQENINIYTCFDAHYGEEASIPSEGVLVNRQITRENVLHNCQQFVRRNQGRAFKRIEMVFGGDFVHIDNMFKTTTKGTQQTTDGTPQEVVRGAIQLSIDMVKCIKKLGLPVTYRYVPGNHDKLVGFMVATATQMYFDGDQQVSFVINEGSTDAILHGTTLIGFAHGEFPDTRAHNMFLGRYHNLYKKADRAEVLLGHLHQEKTTNPVGVCKVRRLPQAGGTHAWAEESMFNNEPMHGSMSFVYNAENGLVETHYYHNIHRVH